MLESDKDTINKEWRGAVYWPVLADWVCEICGEYHGLTWGFVYGDCRCNQCHAFYSMLDTSKNISMTPRFILKPKYRVGAKDRWERTKVPMCEWSEEVWVNFLAPIPGGCS